MIRTVLFQDRVLLKSMYPSEILQAVSKVQFRTVVHVVPCATGY